MAEDNQQTAGWDARQQFVKELEDLDQKANKFKLYIESRPSPNNLLWGFQMYFSSLRWMYRMIKNYIKDKKVNIAVNINKKSKEINREEMDFKYVIRNLRNRLNGFINKNRLDGAAMERIVVPLSLEDDLENLHDALNEVRHDKGLVMPIHSPMRLDPEEAALRGMND